MKFSADFAINFSEVKVKVQGQNRRTDSRPLVIARPSFKISTPNLAVWQKKIWREIILQLKRATHVIFTLYTHPARPAEFSCCVAPVVWKTGKLSS